MNIYLWPFIIDRFEESHVTDQDVFQNEELLPAKVVNSILDVYNECAYKPTSNMVNTINKTDEIKW